MSSAIDQCAGDGEARGNRVPRKHSRDTDPKSGGDWYFPYSPERLNDATRFYVSTIERAAQMLGWSLRRVPSIRAVPANADVFLIDCKTAVRLLVLRPGCRYWLWLQGTSPEEVELHYNSPLRKWLWTARELVAIPRARGTFMVSSAMREHYSAKYGFWRVPSFLMPCVNSRLDPSAFRCADRYSRLTFVYAGSMHKWQCFDLSLKVFDKLRARRPDAELTVLTHDQKEAKAEIERAGVRGVRVFYVALEKLNEELRKYKYGFVLRRPHVVNRVATPTKASSYMAAGVIPVMTAEVSDYVERLGGVPSIVMSRTCDPEEIAQRILEFEERPLAPEAIRADYSRAFAEYFDHEGYIAALGTFLRRTGFGGID